MPDLIPDEIETLRMLAGQLPRRLGSKQMLCVMEMVGFGLCRAEEPHRLTDLGIAYLETITGTIETQSHRAA